MIAPMEKLLVAAPKGMARELLRALQEAGVVHLETLRPEALGEEGLLREYRLSPEEMAELRGWEGVLSGVEHTFALFEETPEPTRPFPGDLEAARGALTPIQNQAEALLREVQELEEDLEGAHLFVRVFSRLAEMAQGLDRSPWVRTLGFLVSEKELPRLEGALKPLEDRYLLAHEPLEGGRVAVLLVVHRADLEEAKLLLSRQALAELKLPKYADLPLSQVAQTLKETLEKAPQELSEARQALQNLKKEARSTLNALWTRAKDEVARLRALQELAAGRFGLALLGYVPQTAKPRVEETLNRFKDRLVYAFEPVDEHEADRVPVALENPPWVKPFELLISFLNTPKYGAYDPSRVIAIFFPFWFGMIVGDIGYALLFALLGRWLSGFVSRNEPLVIDLFALRLKPQTIGQLTQILWRMVFWTVVFGVIYGEFFGTLFEHLGVFGTKEHPGLIPILIHRIDTAATANFLILVSVGFGVLLVFYGLILRAWLALKHHHMKHFWEGVGYLGGLVGLLALAYAYLGGVKASGVNLLILLGFGLFLLAVILSRMWLMIPELPTQAGHILSYIRIYAVGAAGGILAGLLTDVGFALAQNLGLFGVVLGILVGGMLHLIILILTTLGHMLQPIRLLWVEFFTKFGFYEESGRPYRPFKSVREGA
ncbi:MAG: V-type ATP synthase subunit I [Thermaceae bacterium]